MAIMFPGILCTCAAVSLSYHWLYETLHANPELSKHECETSALIAQELNQMSGMRVVWNIGGYGVVGVLENGAGPTIMLRAELDALPLLEQSGLAYSSTKRMIDRLDGIEKPVMHACAHDLHMVSVVCASRVLHASRQSWRGTLVFLFQPSEEDGSGAQAMVDDGLYDLSRAAVPEPDVILAGHTMPMKTGRIATRPGVFNSAAVSLKVTIFGRGGHGARPHVTVDPIVVSSSIVMKLQTIVSRKIAPQESVVITVGSLHAGTTENVISDMAVMKINIRALSASALDRARDSVLHIIRSECYSFECPNEPLFETISSFPLLFNDIATTQKVTDAMKRYFGESFTTDIPISMGSEDLCNLTRPKSECCFWNIGCIDKAVWEDARLRGTLDQIKGNHNAEFAPAIQPTLSVAVEALVLATMICLGVTY